MIRTIAIAAAFALMATAASADAGAPYKLDAAGKCHDAKGAFAKAELCRTTVKPGPCKDAKGKFAKCDAPGAKPVKK